MRISGSEIDDDLRRKKRHHCEKSYPSQMEKKKLFSNVAFWNDDELATSF